MESHGPYLSLVVVTRHDTNPGLFNTKFRLNFGRSANPGNNTQTEEEANSIIIGRSSTCNMILDYRTVSTVHAKIHFHVSACCSPTHSLIPTTTTQLSQSYPPYYNSLTHAHYNYFHSPLIIFALTHYYFHDYSLIPTILPPLTSSPSLPPQDGKFFLSDKRSSNGTMIYLQDPVHLPYMVPMKFRMGRTTLTLQAKRSWTSTMRGVFGGSVANCDGLPYPSASDVFDVLLEASNNTNKADPQTSSNILEADGQVLSR